MAEGGAEGGGGGRGGGRGVLTNTAGEKEAEASSIEPSPAQASAFTAVGWTFGKTLVRLGARDHKERPR